MQQPGLSVRTTLPPRVVLRASHPSAQLLRAQPPLRGAVVTRSSLAAELAEMSAGDPLPEDYESRSGEAKQRLLWEDRIMKSAFSEASLPPLTKISVLGLIFTSLSTKMDRKSDESPPRWKKAIHAHGSVAKVQLVPAPGQPFTGIFESGAEGLIRMSVTGDPADRGFAPGLAWKVFVDGKPSVNVSALITLSGSTTDHNLFRDDFSNVVPKEPDLGTRVINGLFRLGGRTGHPTKMYMREFGEVKANGEAVASPRYPFQIFLRPSEGIGFGPPHKDFREELAGLRPGAKLFDVLGVDPGEYTDEAAEKAEAAFGEDEASRAAYKEKAILIGSLVMKSPFVASAYGDSQLFFRHQRYANT